MNHPRSIPEWAKAENGKWLTSPRFRQLPGLVHGFTLRAAGDAAAPGFGAGLCAAAGARELHLLRQVHGTHVAAPDDDAARPEADGWAGRPEPGVLLGILTADCLPVLLCHPPSGTLGLAHAGWRGATAGIVRRVLQAMAVPADQVWAALGPAIGPCCYQVGDDVARAVPAGSSRLTPWPGRADRFRLDLAGLVSDQLREAGVRSEHLDCAGRCTACDSSSFFSYRAEGGETGRLCAFLGWAEMDGGTVARTSRRGRLVGLTGGIGSGKTTAARLFAEQGARVVDADQLARRAVEPGRPALLEIHRAFGDEVLRPDGSLDREALGARVFRDPAARERLNAIVHPRVEAEVRREVAEIRRADPTAIVVYDVPLLYETGMEDRFDLVVVVYLPREEQKRRLIRRDGLPEAEAEARLESQWDIEEKARRATAVLDNRGSVEDLRRQVAALLGRIRRESGRDGRPLVLN